MSAHPLLSTTPTPLMLPVTALYDLIISENSLIRPWPPSYPSRGLSKDSDSGAFCSEGGRLASGWLVSTSAINSLPHILTSFHQVHSIWQYPILELNSTSKIIWNKIFRLVFWGCYKNHVKHRTWSRKGNPSTVYMCAWWEGFADC